MTASRDALEALHGVVADTLREEITKARDGDVPASLLTAAINFLKNNGIEAVAKPASPLGRLVDSLPFTQPEDHPN